MASHCTIDVSYFADLNRKVREQAVPLSGSIEPTRRCNLRCTHCYAGPAPARAKSRELPTERWLGILDEAAGAGCLFLLITGGEPLLREDFAELYRHARGLGMLVTVFTNATLVGPEHVALFAELPPRHVELTLYGATPGTHDGICGVPGSFDRALAGARLLLDAGVRVLLKTILMTSNRHEFHDIERLAASLGVKFRMDAAIFPRLDGRLEPLALRVPAHEAVDLEMGDPERQEAWRKYVERVGDYPVSDRLYNCGAGVSSFHVDPAGRIQPCLMTPHIRRPLEPGAFPETWRQIGRLRDAKRAPPDLPCRACARRALCGCCPAFFKLENGSETAVSEYLCRIGESRLCCISGTANQRISEAAKQRNSGEVAGQRISRE